MPKKRLCLSIDEELFAKLRILAECGERTPNSQIYVLIRRFVEEYERRNGKVVPEHTVSHSL